MIDGRKRKKGFMSIVCETYKDFAENTSIHGLKYTVKDDIARYEKVFWMLVVLAGFGGSGYMTVLFWDRYTSNPTRTSIQTTHAPTTTVPFPAITICNINRIIHSKIADVIKKMDLNESEEQIVRQSLPQLLAFAVPGRIRYNISDLNLLHDILVKNDYYDIKFLMKKLSASCKEVILKCRWNFTAYPCSELFEDSMTLDGPCCSFNYVGLKQQYSIKYSLFSGYNSGLVVLLNPMVEEKQYLSLHSSGVKVIVHHPEDYPGIGSITKIVSGGRQSFLQISGSKIVCSDDIRRLPVDQRQCSYSEELSLKYFPTYGDTNCLTECDAKHFLRKCGCVPYFLAFKDSKVCNVTSIPCLDTARKQSTAEILKGCNCPPQCEDDFYRVLSTATHINFTMKGISSQFTVHENLSQENIIVQVFFSNQRQTILYRDVITSTIYLLSSFGGVYSLFLGCSFITIIEIIYYSTLRFLVNLKIFGQMHRGHEDLHKDNFKQRKLHLTQKMVFKSAERNVFIN